MTNQNDEAFAAGDTGVEEIPLQHGVVRVTAMPIVHSCAVAVAW